MGIYHSFPASQFKSAVKSIPPMKQISSYGEENSGKVPHTKIKIGDEVFDSVAEHDRYLELLVMQKTGQIKELECHPKYEILPKQVTPPGKQNFKPVIYTPDFRYKTADGREVVEEVKSEYTRKEKDYVIRRKLIFYTLGVYVEEIVR